MIISDDTEIDNKKTLDLLFFFYGQLFSIILTTTLPELCFRSQITLVTAVDENTYANFSLPLLTFFRLDRMECFCCKTPLAMNFSVSSQDVSWSTRKHLNAALGVWSDLADVPATISFGIYQ